MSDIYWLNAVSGNFATPGDWSGGTAPGPSDTAILDADGGPYTVLYDGNTTEQVQGLQLGSNATFKVTVGDFFAGTVSNAGTILEYSDFGVIGVLSNSGLIDISGGGKVGTLVIFQSCTLIGSGTVKIGGEGAEIGGSQSGLVNTDNTISGSGKILLESFVNDAAGKIDGAGPNRLTIATAKNTIMNAGMIESSGVGGILIRSPIANDGTVTVDRGIFTFEGAVSGSGEAVIGGGTLDFQSSFIEAVTFIAGGTLELAQSEAYSGTVTGFSKKGKTTLDLTDISFVGAGEATYSGKHGAGVLTVTDGSHTARITLSGAYAGDTFIAASDGHGGTDVVADANVPSGNLAHTLVAAMARLGVSFATQYQLSEPGFTRQPFLACARAAMT